MKFMTLRWHEYKTCIRCSAYFIYSIQKDSRRLYIMIWMWMWTWYERLAFNLRMFVSCWFVNANGFLGVIKPISETTCLRLQITYKNEINHMAYDIRPLVFLHTFCTNTSYKHINSKNCNGTASTCNFEKFYTLHSSWFNLCKCVVAISMMIKTNKEKILSYSIFNFLFATGVPILSLLFILILLIPWNLFDLFLQ